MANIIGISSTRMLFGSCVSAVALSFVVGAGTAYAAGDIEEGYEINTGYFGGVAIKGYDPVAYFRMQQALKGSEEYAHEWLGVTWHFANDAHRDAFAETPGKYAPQYGGHCADGVAYGQSTANIDPGEYVQQARGVYAVRVGVTTGGKTQWYDGVANHGVRPTVDGSRLLLEAHLFDFAGDLYGKYLRVAFVEYLRGERKFDSLEALKQQITADSQKAREKLAINAAKSGESSAF